MKYSIYYLAFMFSMPLCAMQKYTVDNACHLMHCLTCCMTKKVKQRKKYHHLLIPTSSVYEELLDKKSTRIQAPQEKIQRNYYLPLETISEEDEDDESCEQFIILLNDKPIVGTMR